MLNKILNFSMPISLRKNENNKHGIREFCCCFFCFHSLKNPTKLYNPKCMFQTRSPAKSSDSRHLASNTAECGGPDWWTPCPLHTYLQFHTYLQNAFRYSGESLHVVKPTPPHLKTPDQIAEPFLSKSHTAYSFGWLPSWFLPQKMFWKVIVV